MAPGCVNWQLKTSTGIGLANTARLQHYGENHRFDIHNRNEGGVVEVVIPMRSVWKDAVKPNWLDNRNAVASAFEIDESGHAPKGTSCLKDQNADC
jgi:hypothetical protein